jgi:hypothetical protein
LLLSASYPITSKALVSSPSCVRLALRIPQFFLL